MTSIRESKRELLLITICTFITHGLIVFNDGIYWDDWYVLNLAKEGWPQLFEGFDIWGISPQAYLHWAMYLITQKFAPHFIISYKLAVFLILLAVNLIIYILCERSRILSRFESLWIALLFTTYNPVKMWAATTVTTFHGLSIFIFFLACLIATYNTPPTSPQNGHGHFRWLLRLVSLAAFYLSFHLQSLLVFYFGFLGYWFFLKKTNLVNASHAAREIFGFFKSRLDYLLLPFVFWGIKIFFFPPDKDHAYYNRLIFEPVLILKNLLEHVFYTFFQEYNNALGIVVDNPVSYLLAMVFFFLFLGKKMQNNGTAQQTLSLRSLICFGSVLYILAILPYVLVGKSPLVESGYYSRHTLLTPLPVAIISVALARLIPAERGLKTRVFILGMLLTGFVIATNDNYLLWQARWIKNRSVMHNLSKDETARYYSKYIVVDEFKIGQPYDELTEWRTIFMELWKKGESDVFYLEGVTKNFPGSYPDGHGESRLLICIYKGQQYQDIRYAALKYFYFRLFDKGKMDNFLDTFTRIEIKKLSPDA